MMVISRHAASRNRKLYGFLKSVDWIKCGLALVVGGFYLSESFWMESSSIDDFALVDFSDRQVSTETYLQIPKQYHATAKTKKDYFGWREYASELAGELPEDILRILRTEDPFGVRSFEKRLLESESSKNRRLTHDELQELFPCPKERITLPDQRNTDKARAFRNETEPYFLFFQHLRKAGGTNFCTLAKKNLKKKKVPKYFCMPDYRWNKDKGTKGAGYLIRWKNEEIIQNMRKEGHKIAGNEWDPFDPDRFFDLPATFATSFRRPLDRALSQFRFECIEERGCKIKNITKWWNKRGRDETAPKSLSNVYTWTFSNAKGIRKTAVSTTASGAMRRKKIMGKALDAVAKFNLVMAMEWLSYAQQHVTDVLGFKDTQTLMMRVRPFNGKGETMKRNDGQETNEMGASGISKASWTPEEYLTPDTYKAMNLDLALDHILTDAARRMFLERIVCNDIQEFD